jgi:23S rRNA (guanosine2251-2'-O)-methyltransferase
LKEWIIGRNPVMEVLQAKRRQVFRLLFASGIEEKGRILEMKKIAQSRKIPVEIVPRDRLIHWVKTPREWRLKSVVTPTSI